jgi:hypothetical protein
MSLIARHSRLLIVAVCCAALGAGVGAIASAGASSGQTKSGRRTLGRSLRGGGLRRLARHAVHGDLTIATRTGLETVSFDRGRIQRVNGQQLTITEGIRQASSRTVTVTVPANARVRDNRRVATMSELKDGQRVLVIRAPKRTFVIAATATKH